MNVAALKHFWNKTFVAFGRTYYARFVVHVM